MIQIFSKITWFEKLTNSNDCICFITFELFDSITIFESSSTARGNHLRCLYVLKVLLLKVIHIFFLIHVSTRLDLIWFQTVFAADIHTLVSLAKLVSLWYPHIKVFSRWWIWQNIYFRDIIRKFIKWFLSIFLKHLIIIFYFCVLRILLIIISVWRLVYLLTMNKR